MIGRLIAIAIRFTVVAVAYHFWHGYPGILIGLAIESVLARALLDSLADRRLLVAAIRYNRNEPWRPLFGRIEDLRQPHDAR